MRWEQGLDIDTTEAMFWYEKAAEQNHIIHNIARAWVI